jgi:hypothetical protein
MRYFVICVALGVLPAGAGTLDVPLSVVYQFQHEPPPAILESIQTELDEIMFPVGLRFTWQSLATNTGRELYNELIMLKFYGDCDIANIRAQKGYPGPFGWTHIIDGQVSHFIGINCDGVRIVLQWDLLESSEEARVGAYGRAVARVLAHEICHALLGKKHSLSGIGKGSYNDEDLLSKRFVFSKKQAESLHRYGADLLRRTEIANGQ